MNAPVLNFRRSVTAVPCATANPASALLRAILSANSLARPAGSVKPLTIPSRLNAYPKFSDDAALPAALIALAEFSDAIAILSCLLKNSAKPDAI